MYFKVLFHFLGLTEGVFGPAFLSLITKPLIRIDLLKRERDFPMFVQLRGALGSEFWKGIDAREHYYKMVRDWHEGGAVVVFYHRLSLPRWRKRFQVKGPLPQAHPDWGKRPVIFTFLHTGPYGLINYWLRSQGIPSASLTGGLPLIVENEHYKKILALGDERHGLRGVPHAFQGHGALRDSFRFLTPGHAIVVALDGGRPGEEKESCKVDGVTIFLKQGAVRMAAQANAILIPVSVRRTAFCHFEIHFRAPVPDELVQKPDAGIANQYLVSDLWRDVKEDPSDLNWTTLEEFVPSLNTPRTSWP